MLKKISKVMIGSAGLLAISAVAAPLFISDDNASADSSANTTFQVNVAESLSVSITTPTSWASGNIDTLLRNKINVSVTSNNAQGFHASMYANNTSLINSANSTYTLPTLTSDWTRSSNVTNFWGYSMDAAEGNQNPTGTYHAMTNSSSSPIAILDSNQAASGSQDVYFGAKADITKAAGTYTGTVIINVVTGAIDASTNPATPASPATPDNPNNTPTYAAGTTGVGISTVDGTAGGTAYNGTTTYTSVSTSDGNTTTTTQVSGGDNRSSYAPAQGVREHSATTGSTGTNLATALAVTAVVTAASGIGFFVAAKRRDDDDEEEEY